VKISFYLFILFFIGFTQLVKAQDTNTFEIPRSSVIDIKDPSSGRVYPLFIKLPRSYKSHSDESYPVIYLTDAWYKLMKDTNV